MTSWCGILPRRLAGITVKLATLQQGVLAGKLAQQMSKHCAGQAFGWASLPRQVLHCAPMSALLTSASRVSWHCCRPGQQPSRPGCFEPLQFRALCCPHEHEQASGQLVYMKRMQVL